MKQARIEWQGQVRDVLVNEHDQVRLDDGTVLKEGEFRWLPPADGTLFALGLNYADHASELEFKPPTEPLVFIKAPNTFTGHQQQSVRPDNVEYMHYEAELVVVIGKPRAASAKPRLWIMSPAIPCAMTTRSATIWKTTTARTCG